MTFKVGDKFRTNPLSIRPGGYTVCVQKTSGEILEYDKIKNPAAYIKRLEGKTDVEDAWIKSS